MPNIELGEYKYLNFVLTQPIWLEFDEKESEVLGWITEKPRADNGYIDKDTILTYSHMYPDIPTRDVKPTLNFIIIPGEDTAEFLIGEIKKFVDSGVFRIIKSVDVNNIILTPNGTIIDSNTILSADNINIIMGIDEAKHSKYVGVGDIVSLQDLIKCYVSHKNEDVEFKIE